MVDHYERPRNVGSFQKDDPDVGTGLVGAPACGDVMRLQIKVDDDGNIVDSCFKTFGCGSAIASSSVATEWIKGRSVDEVLTIKNRDIAKHLSLPPVKLHCSMLAEDAIKAAVKDIQVPITILDTSTFSTHTLSYSGLHSVSVYAIYKYIETDTCSEKILLLFYRIRLLRKAQSCSQAYIAAAVSEHYRLLTMPVSWVHCFWVIYMFCFEVLDQNVCQGTLPFCYFVVH